MRCHCSLVCLRVDYVLVYADIHTGATEGTRLYALLEVCRQMRKETKALYYSSNDSLFPMCFSSLIYPCWTSALKSSERSGVLRYVTLFSCCGTAGAMLYSGCERRKEQCCQMWRPVCKYGMQKKVQIVGTR